MDNNETTKTQMHEFCERARAAVAADRMTLVASQDGLTNMAASTSGSETNTEVLASIIADLARTIVTIAPGISIAINIPGSEPMIVNMDTAHIEVTQHVISEVRSGNMG